MSVRVGPACAPEPPLARPVGGVAGPPVAGVLPPVGAGSDQRLGGCPGRVGRASPVAALEAPAELEGDVRGRPHEARLAGRDEGVGEDAIAERVEG